MKILTTPLPSHISAIKSVLDETYPHKTLNSNPFADGFAFVSFFVAVDSSDNLLGFIRFFTDFATVSVILDVYVQPAHRRKGIATALLARFHDDIGHQTITILGSRIKSTLYRRLGFVKASVPTLQRDPAIATDRRLLALWHSPDFMEFS